MKYLILVVQSKRQITTQKNTEIEKKLTDNNHDRYITTPEFNKLTAENFAARLKQADLVTKTDFDDKLKCLNRKINSNKTKHLLVQNELNRFKKCSVIYFLGGICLKKMVPNIIQYFSQ